MSLSGGRYQSFVVRILSLESGAIQGEITHVATRESTRFRDARRMVDFMLDHLKVLPENAHRDLECGEQG